MKRGCHRRRSSLIREIGLPDDVNIPCSSKNRYILYCHSESISFVLRRQAIEMKKISVSRMVSSVEETKDPTRVTGRSRDVVSYGRRSCVGGDIGGGRKESRVGS